MPYLSVGRQLMADSQVHLAKSDKDKYTSPIQDCQSTLVTLKVTWRRTRMKI